MVDGDEHCSQHQRAGAPELHGQQRCVTRPRPSPVTLCQPSPPLPQDPAFSSPSSAPARATSSATRPWAAQKASLSCRPTAAGAWRASATLVTAWPSCSSRSCRSHAHVTIAPPSPSLPPPPTLHISNRRCFVHPTHLHPPPSRSPTGEFNLIKCSKCCGRKKAVKYKGRDG